MPSRDTWEFINSFAPWLAAIGTIAAVITSLFLARRADRVTLNVNIGIRTLSVEGGGPGHGTEHVWASITNLARRSATLTHLYFKPVPWRKSGFIWLAPSNPISSPFPITLEDGKSANYASEVSSFRTKFAEITRGTYSGFSGAVRVRLTRFCVATTTGYVANCRLEKPLRNLLREVAKSRPSKEAA